MFLNPQISRRRITREILCQSLSRPSLSDLSLGVYSTDLTPWKISLRSIPSHIGLLMWGYAYPNPHPILRTKSFATERSRDNGFNGFNVFLPKWTPHCSIDYFIGVCCVAKKQNMSMFESENLLSCFLRL